MHTVDRGPEPPGLGSVRRRYTARWVRHYRDEHGPKPSDSKWRVFHADVSGVFFSICGYCEETCKGDVDHFRPKSKFPELVYEWSNWVLACHVCNQEKSGEWPTAGYVDPCTRSQAARAESYFDFDTKTGEILPQSKLAPGRRRKAVRMIADLKLNAYHHRKQRALWLRLVSEALKVVNNTDNEELIEFVASREKPLSSITRAWLEQQGYFYRD